MHQLIIAGTQDTPEIILNEQDNKFLISGRSLPEDPIAFFTPIIDWFDELSKQIKNDVSFALDFKFEYFNTSSSKLVLDILDICEEMFNNGVNIMINWYYLKGDDDMFDAGEGYQEMVDVPFNLIEF